MLRTRILSKLAIPLAALAAAITLSALADPPGFHVLAPLPSNTMTIDPVALSGNGRVIVGTLTSSPNGGIQHDAARWTEETGWVSLGDLPGGLIGSGAVALSTDGNTVVGTSAATLGNQAFRWTAAGGMVGLGSLPSNTFSSSARGVCGDGSIVVGWYGQGGDRQVFRWTPSTGMQFPGIQGYAAAISRDGTTYVGTTAYTAAFRVNAQGITYLPPAGDPYSYATSVSADGSLIAGYGYSASGYGDTSAFRWSQASNYEFTGAPPGNTDSIAYGISPDGALVLGYGYYSRYGGYDAFVWDHNHGRRTPHDFLADQGLQTGPITLRDVLGVSDDGRTFMGTAYDATGNRVWLATLGTPCPADYTGDNSTTVQDFLTFLQLFGQNSPRADFNNDGAVNLQDFLSYLAAFAQGC
jgi:uncharacterized membrane protein